MVNSLFFHTFAPKYKTMITKEDIEKLDVKVIEQSGVGITIDITYDGNAIKRIEA